MEVLGHIICEAVDNGHWKWIKPSRGSSTILHLFFVDIYSCLPKLLWNKHETFKILFLISGQRVNVNISKMMVSPNIEGGTREQLSLAFDIPITKQLGIYLGTPSLHGRVNKSTYSFLIEKVCKHFTGWKQRTLSKATRLLLIKSTTSTISSYVM